MLASDWLAIAFMKEQARADFTPDQNKAIVIEAFEAQLVSAYTEVDGVRLPSRRRAYRRGPDHRPIPAPVMVSFDLTDVLFTPASDEPRPPRGRNGAKP